MRVVIVSPYSVVPPRYGGPLRVFHLARELGREHDVLVLAKQAQRSEVLHGFKPVTRDGDHFVETAFRDPTSVIAYGISSYLLRCPPFWQSAIAGRSETTRIREVLGSADVVHIEQPWPFAGVREHLRDLGVAPKLVFSAQNFEAGLNPPSSIRGGWLLGKPIARSIEHLEREAVGSADAHLAVTTDDAANLNDRYGHRDWVIIPNGVDTDHRRPASHEERRTARADLGVTNGHVALFVGSLHGPNVEAARIVLRVAQETALRDVTFLIVGAVAGAIGERVPTNVRLVGPVESVDAYFQAADVAVNPMLRGSGTNLKQLDYMAMGLPTITTPAGARGLPVENGVTGVVLEPDRFVEDFATALARCDRSMGVAARDAVRATHDWRTIGDSLRAVYRRLI